MEVWHLAWSHRGCWKPCYTFGALAIISLSCSHYYLNPIIFLSPPSPSTPKPYFLYIKLPLKILWGHLCHGQRGPDDGGQTDTLVNHLITSVKQLLIRVLIIQFQLIISPDWLLPLAALLAGQRSGRWESLCHFSELFWVAHPPFSSSTLTS